MCEKVEEKRQCLTGRKKIDIAEMCKRSEVALFLISSGITWYLHFKLIIYNADQIFAL